MSTIEIPVLEDGVWIVGPDGELIPDYDATFPTINEGEVVHGTVVRVDKDEVLVDIGYKSEGVIPLAELSIRRAVNPADEVSLGEEIDALVMTKEDADGRLILSKKRARFELAWKAIEAAAESGEAVNGRVIEVVKGGLILDLGVRGFLPASLIDIRRVQDLDEFTGQELRCKVIELNRSRNNVVLSRRAILEDERKDMRQGILDGLNPGDVVDGQISNIVDFGAFVDLDGMDGLIHISELSWSHVNHPSEILEIGQTVKVKVLDIDRERQRISLGLKQTQSDPWQQVLESYHEEDVVEGRVTKVVTFGAFVEILPGVEGLVHISELAQHHVENPREVVSQGDPVNVLILEIDGDRRRLSLSLKRVEEGAEPLPRADGGESVHLTPNLRLSEDVFPGEADGHDERAEGEAMSDTENEVVELAEAALALDADAEDRLVAAVVAEEIAIELAEEAVIVEAVAIELAEEAVVAEEIAIELAEEAVIVEAVAIELAEEAVLADAVAQELAIEALEADAAGDTEAAVELAEEAILVEEIAIELAEEAIVADAVAIELAEEAIVADAVAIELAEEAIVADAVAIELAEEAIVADAVAIELAEEAIVEEVVAEELAEEALAIAGEDPAA
ncbi:MAG: 30S ribosomal protein S1 [Thermoleophilia bacterium]